MSFLCVDEWQLFCGPVYDHQMFKSKQVKDQD